MFVNILTWEKVRPVAVNSSYGARLDDAYFLRFLEPWISSFPV